MARDEKRKSGFPLKDFLLKLILMIIFVLLLMWLIPWPNNKVLTDRIFMKKANQYWNKEVKKMNKLKRKRQKR